MSDSSPRWPGSNGAPGLDFSPRRTGTAAGEGPEGPSAKLNGSPDGATSSAATPTRSSDAAAQGSATPPPGGPGKGPDPQESAASWAWQPLGAEPDSAAASRPAASSGAGDGATTIRSASSAPATAAVAGGAISGAAARAADQGRKTPATTRRTTPSPATSTPSAATRRTGTRRTRKARLRLARLDPWSVMKTTFLFSIAFGIILMVIAWVLWTVLAGSGALDSLNQFMTTLIGQEGEEFNIENYVNGPRVLGAAALLAAIDIVILTAVATLFAFLYNLAATVIGGLEVTLAED